MATDEFLQQSSFSQHEDHVSGFWPRNRGGASAAAGSHSLANSQPGLSMGSMDPDGDHRADAHQRRQSLGRRSGTGGDEESTKFELDTVCASNSCMPTILSCIDYIQEKFAAEHAKNPYEKQPFMKKLLAHLSDTRHHPNIRIYIAKIILLRQKRFESHAKDFIEPLLLLCLRDLKQPTHPGSHETELRIHYFLRDVCFLLLEWRYELPEKLHKLCSEFMNMILERIYDLDLAVCRSNAQLFELFYRKWAGKFVLNKQLVLSLLRESNEKVLIAFCFKLFFIVFHLDMVFWDFVFFSDESHVGKSELSFTIHESAAEECVVAN